MEGFVHVYLLKMTIFINLDLSYESNFFFFFTLQETFQWVTVPGVNI